MDDPHDAEQIWNVTAGDHHIRVIGVSAESVKSLIREVVLSLLASTHFKVEPATAEEIDAEIEVDEEEPPTGADGHQHSH